MHAERSHARPCAGLVAHVGHRHEARRHPLPRLRDRGSDRARQLSADGVADASRRAADARTGRPARGGAGCRRRPRAAGPVDRDRANGRHLRPAAQWRDGVGDQHAGRRAWRRRRAGDGAIRRYRRTRRHGDGADAGHGGCSRDLAANAGQAFAGLRPPFPPARSAGAASARARRPGCAAPAPSADGTRPSAAPSRPRLQGNGRSR